MSYSSRPLITRPIPVSGGGGGLVVVNVDVSYNPTVVVEPIINVDVSFNPTVVVEPIINVDVSFNPVLHVDVSFNPTVTLQQNLDAFLRLRVSNPYTLFEYNSILGKNPLYIDELVTPGASSTANTTESYIAMSVTSAGNSVIRQSHEAIVYQPGKSKLVIITGVLRTAATTGVVSRIGTFDSTMGYFVQMDAAGGVSVVERTLAGDNSIPRSSWTNKLDNPFRPDYVDFTKAQIFVFDFEWLGVGQVRCGVVIGGELYYYYKFSHANGLTAPYIPTAKLPIRYEISSTGGAGEMRMICSTVISEGGVSPIGKTFSRGIYDDSVGVRLRANDVVYRPLIALRLRPTAYHNRTSIKLKLVDLFNTTNALGSWKLLLNPTIAGTPALTFADHDSVRESSAQYWIETDTTSPPPHSITNEGYVIASDYYTQQANSILVSSVDELIAEYPITTNLLTGVSDIVVLCANNYSGSNTTLLFNLKWLELA